MDGALTHSLSSWTVLEHMTIVKRIIMQLCILHLPPPLSLSLSPFLPPHFPLPCSFWSPIRDHLRQQTVKMTHQLKHQQLTLKSAGPPPHHLPPLLKDETSKLSQKVSRKKSSKTSTSVALKKEEDVCTGMQLSKPISVHVYQQTVLQKVFSKFTPCLAPILTFWPV